MLGNISYSALGTSNKRKEKKSDHKRLRELMKKRWSTIKNFNYKKPEEIRAWQLKKIKKLITHAFKTVPLYKEKYSAVGFTPSNLKTWEDFEALPLLYKEELIKGFPNKTVSNRFNFEFTTRSSGSSGKFVTLAVSPEAIYLDTIQGIRQFLFQSGGNYKPKDLVLFIYTAPWWVSSVDGDYKTKFLPTTTKIEQAAKVIAKLKPKIISLYPTYLMKLYKKKVSLKRSGVKLIIVHSEQSTLKERVELSNFFGIPALDEFSSEELTRIALECPYRNYHIEEDACYIEIINRKTQKHCQDGEKGLVVGTNLLNEATPIIRYFQGDLASIETTLKCKCGSNFRIMKSIDGRLMDSIVTDDDEIIPASSFMDLAYNWYLLLDVPVHGLQYQIVQRENGNLCVYLIPGPYGISSSQKRRIKESMYQLLPRKIKVNVQIVSKLPVKKGPKFRPVISFKKKK